MTAYHAKSWSQQAREMCNTQIKQIGFGWKTIEDASKFFSKSYRNCLIRYRAAKRFGRLVRMGKVNFN